MTRKLESVHRPQGEISMKQDVVADTVNDHQPNPRKRHIQDVNTSHRSLDRPKAAKRQRVVSNTPNMTQPVQSHLSHEPVWLSPYLSSPNSIGSSSRLPQNQLYPKSNTEERRDEPTNSTSTNDFCGPTVLCGFPVNKSRTQKADMEARNTHDNKPCSYSARRDARAYNTGGVSEARSKESYRVSQPISPPIFRNIDWNKGASIMYSDEPVSPCSKR